MAAARRLAGCRAQGLATSRSALPGPSGWARTWLSRGAVRNTAGTTGPRSGIVTRCRQRPRRLAHSPTRSRSAPRGRLASMPTLTTPVRSPSGPAREPGQARRDATPQGAPPTQRGASTHSQLSATPGDQTPERQAAPAGRSGMTGSDHQTTPARTHPRIATAHVDRICVNSGRSPHACLCAVWHVRSQPWEQTGGRDDRQLSIVIRIQAPANSERVTTGRAAHVRHSDHPVMRSGMPGRQWLCRVSFRVRSLTVKPSSACLSATSMSSWCMAQSPSPSRRSEMLLGAGTRPARRSAGPRPLS